MTKETERALRLQTQLIRGGVGPELAELYTVKHATRLSDTEPDALATEVLEQIPERLKTATASGSAYDPVADGKARGAAQAARNEDRLAFR